jgi:hypothetical protein
MDIQLRYIYTLVQLSHIPIEHVISLFLNVHCLSPIRPLCLPAVLTVYMCMLTLAFFPRSILSVLAFHAVDVSILSRCSPVPCSSWLSGILRPYVLRPPLLVSSFFPSVGPRFPASSRVVYVVSPSLSSHASVGLVSPLAMTRLFTFSQGIPSFLQPSAV